LAFAASGANMDGVTGDDASGQEPVAREAAAPPDLAESVERSRDRTELAASGLERSEARKNRAVTARERSAAAGARTVATRLRSQAARLRRAASRAAGESSDSGTGADDRAQLIDERERVADDRDGRADERERVADAREGDADRRDRAADVRDRRVDEHRDRYDKWRARAADMNDQIAAQAESFAAFLEERDRDRGADDDADAARRQEIARIERETAAVARRNAAKLRDPGSEHPDLEHLPKLLRDDRPQ
jgi:hypothetical protein